MLHARQRLGDFEIVRPLGKGGMGEVYEAQQENPSRRVALKVLPDHLATHPDAIERFRREADALARLDHPGIVRIFTTGRTPAGTFYFAMQLVRGVSLAQLIRDAATPDGPRAANGSNGPDAPTVTEPEAANAADNPVRCYRKDRFRFVVRAGVALADALAAAHAEQVLHRDLKPGNVMADHRGHLYLMDFGLARLLDDDATNANTVKGTPLYMAPEQACGMPVDPRSDVFSLGVLLYELATGGVGPYATPRDDRDAVFVEVRAGRLRPLRDIVPNVPVPLARVIEKATRFRPEDRYPTAREMLADLARLGDGPTAQKPAPLRGGSRDRLPFRRGVLAAGGVVLLGALVVAAAVLWPGRKEPPWSPWPENPLPASRHARKPREAIPLFHKEGGSPIWSQTLCGDRPAFRPMKDHACILQSIKGHPTFALLDYDPVNWYLFEVKLQQVRDSPEGHNVLGAFLGYRRSRDDPGKRYPCLALRLQETPGGAAGGPRLEVGWCQIEDASAEQRVWLAAFRPLPGLRAEIPLGPIPPGVKWRAVSVRVVDHTVAIRVDTQPPLRLTFAELKRAVPGLHPVGGVGVWATTGVGHFGDATLTPLASDRPGP